MVKGRYKLYKKIARGGMAEIFIGSQFGEDGFQRICCIKRILPYYAQDIEFIKMFRDEAHICKRLQHANIVRVEGFEEVEGSYALIMEFINGCDLRATLAACEVEEIRLPVSYILHIIAEAARGLHYAHMKVDELSGKKLEIIHRDISPQNILLSFEGDVKVTDFGIADAEDKSTDTKPGIVKGKYSYMSPEQVTAQQVDVRTDIFALCIVLWEMLAMKRLFQGENEVETISLVRACQIPEDLCVLNASVDQELKALVEKGLKLDPNMRYDTAADLEKTLRQYLSKRYADFTVADLSAFLKKLLATRVKENTEVVRDLLRESALVKSEAVVGAEVNLSFEKDKDASYFRVKDPNKLASSSAEVAAHLSLGGSQDMRGQRERRAKPRSSATPQFNQRMTGAKNLTRSKRKVKESNLWRNIVLLVLVLGIAVVSYANRSLLFKEEPAVLMIDTVPEVVQISVDGKLPWGKYVTTPIKKTLPNGKHFITINRDGFQEESFVVEAQHNMVIKKTKVVLTRIAKMAPTRVSLTANFSDKVRVVLDDGALDDFVEKGRYLNLKNLTFGQSHKLLVYPQPPYAQPTYVCKFIPRAESWQAPYIVELRPTERTCTFPLR